MSNEATNSILLEQDLRMARNARWVVVGAKIRTHDFDADFEIEGEDACFMEGVVTSIVGDSVHFTMTRRVFTGKECPDEVADCGAHGACRTWLRSWRGDRVQSGALVVL